MKIITHRTSDTSVMLITTSSDRPDTVSPITVIDTMEEAICREPAWGWGNKEGFSYTPITISNSSLVKLRNSSLGSFMEPTLLLSWLLSEFCISPPVKPFKLTLAHYQLIYMYT